MDLVARRQSRFSSDSAPVFKYETAGAGDSTSKWYITRGLYNSVERKRNIKLVVKIKARQDNIQFLAYLSIRNINRQQKRRVLKLVQTYGG